MKFCGTCSSSNGRKNRMMVPTGKTAIFVECGPDSLGTLGMVKIMVQVIFPCPLNPHRRFGCLGKQGSFYHKIGLGLSSKSSSQKGDVHFHTLIINIQCLGDSLSGPLWVLGRCPYLTGSISLEIRDCSRWLQGGVSVKRCQISPFNYFSC